MSCAPQLTETRPPDSRYNQKEMFHAFSRANCMMTDQRIAPAALIAVLAVSLSACRIPLSEQPLSDETTSRVDERLLGTWQIDMEPLRSKVSLSEDVKSVRYTVRRAEGKENMLAVVESSNEEKTMPAFTVHFAMHDYLSWGGKEGGPYLILRYEFDDDDRARLFVLDEGIIIDAIESGRLPGQVERDDVQVKSIVIKASTEQLRDFIHRHGESCFDMKTAIPAQRVEP